MGCSNCKKQQVIIYQNVNIPITNKLKTASESQFQSPNKLENPSSSLLSIHQVFTEKTKKLNSIASRNTSNESLRFEKLMESNLNLEFERRTPQKKNS